MEYSYKKSLAALLGSVSRSGGVRAAVQYFNDFNLCNTTCKGPNFKNVARMLYTTHTGDHEEDCEGPLHGSTFLSPCSMRHCFMCPYCSMSPQLFRSWFAWCPHLYGPHSLVVPFLDMFPCSICICLCDPHLSCHPFVSFPLHFFISYWGLNYLFNYFLN